MGTAFSNDSVRKMGLATTGLLDALTDQRVWGVISQTLVWRSSTECGQPSRLAWSPWVSGYPILAVGGWPRSLWAKSERSDR